MSNSQKSYEFPSGPIKPTYTLQPLQSTRRKTQDEDSSSHPLFLDAAAQDETGKGYLKLFAALSEGFVPVEDSSIGYAPTSQQIEEEQAQRRIQTLQRREELTQGVSYLSRMKGGSRVRQRNQKSSDISASSSFMADDELVSSQPPPASSSTPAAAATNRRRVCIRRMHDTLSSTAVPAQSSMMSNDDASSSDDELHEPRANHGNAAGSRADDSDSDTDNAPSYQRRRFRKTVDPASRVYHQLSSAPAPAPAAPAAPAADRIYAHAEGGTVPCTNSDDGDNSDVSESVLRAAEERLGAEIRRRIEVAETATSMRFLNMK